MAEASETREGFGNPIPGRDVAPRRLSLTRLHVGPAESRCSVLEASVAAAAGLGSRSGIGIGAKE
jgi:hypothetical protein